MDSAIKIIVLVITASMGCVMVFNDKSEIKELGKILFGVSLFILFWMWMLFIVGTRF